MRLLTLCLLSLSTLSFSSTYYVSTSGSDSYTSTQAQDQATPWATIGKINATTFVPNDKILFKRGEVWRGSIVATSSGLSGAPIIFGAYGVGAVPIISGTVPITGTWTPVGGNVYTTNATGPIVALFANGKPLSLARYPNQGYLPVSDTLDSITLVCNTLGAENWANATMHVRTEHWTIASKTIAASNSSQKSLKLSAVPVYGLKPGTRWRVHEGPVYR